MSLNLVNLKAIIHKPISGEWGESEGDVNIIRTTNFTNEGRLNLSNVVKRNIDVDKITRKKLLYGDTIIEKSGGSLSQPVGRVIYFDQIDGTYLCNNFTSVIRAKSNIDSRYLFWFLFNNHQNQNTLKYQNKTTGIINLQLERYIEELQIPLPPLPIQKRIAEILDAADALRRKDQELLKKYDELAQAVAAQDASRLVKVPGVGKKTAERLLLELKGKLAPALNKPGFAAASDTQGDILQALIALGYSDKEAQAALKQLPADVSVSDGIKQALKALAR